MKKYAQFALVLALTAVLFTGCGCTNRDMNNATTPTMLPTTQATTAPTTEMTTAPTTMATEPSGTIDNGNGPLEDGTATTGATTDGTTDTTAPEGRASRRMPSGR